MKWILGVSIIAMALGWAGTMTIPAATITPDEGSLKYFSQETEGIAFIDVAGLRSSPLVQDAMYKGQIKSLSPEIGAFVDATGFDVRRDLDQVTIGKMSGRERLVVADARYDKFKAEQFLKDKGRDTETYLGRAIYHDGEASIAFLDKVILFGTDNAVKKAIDQITYPGSLQVRSELLDGIRTIEAGNQVWVVGNFSQEDFPQVGRETPATQILKSLRGGTYQMRVDRDVHARAMGNFADPDSARNLTDLARGFIAVAKLQVAKQQPEFLQVLDGIQISSSGSSVTVRIDESGDLLTKLQSGRFERSLQ